MFVWGSLLAFYLIMEQIENFNLHSITHNKIDFHIRNEILQQVK